MYKDWCLLQGHERLRDLLVTLVGCGTFGGTVQDTRDFPCWHHTDPPSALGWVLHPQQGEELKEFVFISGYSYLSQNAFPSY